MMLVAQLQGGGDGEDANGDGVGDDDVGGRDGEGSLSVALLPLFSQTASTQELDREDDDQKSSKLVKDSEDLKPLFK